MTFGEIKHFSLFNLEEYFVAIYMFYRIFTIFPLIFMNVKAVNCKQEKVSKNRNNHKLQAIEKVVHWKNSDFDDHFQLIGGLYRNLIAFSYFFRKQFLITAIECKT